MQLASKLMSDRYCSCVLRKRPVEDVFYREPALLRGCTMRSECAQMAAKGL